MGGVIVIVLYITRLASREKLFGSKGWKPFVSISLVGGIITWSTLLNIQSYRVLGFRGGLVGALLEPRLRPLYLVAVGFLLIVLAIVAKMAHLERGPIVSRR